MNETYPLVQKLAVIYYYIVDKNDAVWTAGAARWEYKRDIGGMNALGDNDTQGGTTEVKRHISGLGGVLKEYALKQLGLR